MNAIFRLALVVGVAASVAFFLPPPAVEAVTPTPANPQPIKFAAGLHPAYRIDAAGAHLVRTVTLARPSGATTTERRAVSGRTYLRVSNGLFAGLWVLESGLRYVPGEVGATTASPPRTVRFGVDPAIGRRAYIGYLFDAAGRLTGTRVHTLSAASTASGDRDAVINGRRYVRIVNGIWAGYWMPTASGNAAGVLCRAGNRPPAGSSQVLARVAGAGSEVAVTFDMGGRLTPAKAILEYLLLERVCATVFPTGAAVATSQGAAAMAIVRAHPELFEVGNHTQHHCNLRDGGGGAACPSGRPSAAIVAQELAQAAAAIQAATGQTTAPYWRPPYGAHDATTRAAATAAGYTKTVMWAVDTIDWRPVADGGPTTLQVAAKIRGVAAGGIVLAHLGGWNTLDALPYGIYGLRSRGLLVTSVSDLLQ